MPYGSAAMHWQRTIWKIVTNPTLDVIAAIAVVLFAAWFVVETEMQHQHRSSALPILFGHK
jgi:hypothetical protein